MQQNCPSRVPRLDLLRSYLDYPFYMTTSLTDISIDQLRRAIAVKEQLESLQRQLDGLLAAPAPAAAPAVTKKGGMSVAGRARVAAAQRARWARQKRAAAVAAKPPKRGKLSLEGRARIIAAQKARWAKIKAKKGK